jgi:hypothetical protein
MNFIMFIPYLNLYEHKFCQKFNKQSLNQQDLGIVVILALKNFN